MRNVRKYLFPLLGLSLLLAACGSSASSNSSSPSSAAKSSGALVKTASSSKLGTILVNSSGMTLYQLSAERNGKFICTDTTCLQNWHPLTIGSGITPTGVGSLGIVKRPDGTMQVTFKGLPLYTFAADHGPGQTNGEGFKDVGTWSAATTGAATSSSGGGAAPAQTAPARSSGGGGYSY
jgi:predicted lipoprotein with Yx(FWY)xxD motif